MSDENEIESQINSEDWYEGDAPESEDYPVREYDITAAPNDFNIITMFNFIDSGAVKIPGFQRHFVWDIKRASKLIESMVIGLPVPQVFLYEEGKNSFLVIDGQQRLMSLFYFVKGRFPRKDKRPLLRKIVDEQGKLPEDVLHDDQYFSKFNLQLSSPTPSSPNRLNGLNYQTLGDYKTQFDLRTIRNVIIKQNLPADDDSSIYEIFNRLNSGGVNLTSQEIRASLYHSRFYSALHEMNSMPRWRNLLALPVPDLHMKDFEFLLRGFAMLIEGEKYRPSMAKFLNQFSRNAKKFSEERVSHLKQIFEAFLDSCTQLGPKPFNAKNSSKFNISIFEAVFTAQGAHVLDRASSAMPLLVPSQLEMLKSDAQFVQAIQRATSDRSNVLKRLERAKLILTGE